MPDALNEKHVGGSGGRGAAEVKVLPCVSDTSNRGKGQTLQQCLVGTSFGTTWQLTTTNAIVYLITEISDVSPSTPNSNRSFETEALIRSEPDIVPALVHLKSCLHRKQIVNFIRALFPRLHRFSLIQDWNVWKNIDKPNLLESLASFPFTEIH